MSSTTETTTEKKVVVKKTPEQQAESNGLKIYKSGLARGKTDANTQSKDPLRKRLGVMLSTIAGRKEKGKTATFKQIKTKYNAVDDDRENYIKVKGLYETVGLYLSALDVPEKKPVVKKGEQPKTPPSE